MRLCEYFHENITYLGYIYDKVKMSFAIFNPPESQQQITYQLNFKNYNEYIV